MLEISPALIKLLDTLLFGMADRKRGSTIQGLLSQRGHHWKLPKLKFHNQLIHLAPVAQRLRNTNQQINHYPVESAVCFANMFPLDSDLSGPGCPKVGSRCPGDKSLSSG